MYHRPISLGVLKTLSEQKVQLLKIFDSTKSALSEQEREAAQYFINKHIPIWQDILNILVADITSFDALKKQIKLSKELSQSLLDLPFSEPEKRKPNDGEEE